MNFVILLNQVYMWHEADFTFHWTESPALVFSIIMGSSTPMEAILPAHAGAAVEPLTIVQKGEITWTAMRVSLDGVDFCGEASKLNSQNA